MTTIRILAAVLDTQQLILYKEDGETVTIPQGDHRIREILDQVTPILSANQVAEVNLEHFNTYAAFEKKTNGLVKLFRVAKQAVQHFLGSDEDRIEPVTLGKVPAGAVSKDTQKGASVASNIQDAIPHRPRNTAQAIGEIMANATPVSSPEFKDVQEKDSHTIVAVVGEGANASLVPGVEALRDQFVHANKLGSVKGLQTLISRLAAIIATGRRDHSVQDVLRFLERGDLPAADDGSIVAYKVLKTTPGIGAKFAAAPGLFFDCHTGRIPQKVGSYVRVEETLVDRNRRNECSNGLHIARRGYLSNFPGDACVLVKVAPEDVVTVPHRDPNKVRVCGYHIIGLIPDEEFATLRRNRPMTESSTAQRLLGMAISGRHVGVLEEVLVTEPQGGGVKVTQLEGGAKAPRIAQEAVKAVAMDDPSVTTKTVSPKAVNEEVIQQKAQAKAAATPAAPQPAKPVATTPSPAPVGGRKEIAKGLVATMNDHSNNPNVRYEAALGLVQLKKKTKVGYAVLGLAPTDIANLEGMVANGPPPPPQPKETPKMSGNRIEVARQLYNNALNDRRQWPALWLHKRKAKYSWEALGFTKDEIRRINNSKPDHI